MVYLIVFLFIEPLYFYYFKKPLYVHFYPLLKKVSLNELYVLENEFEFYNKLSPKLKSYFEHRLAVYIKKFSFFGQENMVVTDQMKVLISATAVMLTFGMRNYKFTVVDKIILYPDVYFSTVTKAYHKGEFNPKLKAVVFSWKHFLEGYRFRNDNLNLGLHEFAHVLHFQGKIHKNSSSKLFYATYQEILKQIKRPANLKRLISSNYFRVYAYTNEFEFIAVLLEHFFETPHDFKREFPELFEQVRVMINYKTDV